jgi:hypothetical protein
MNCIVSSAYDSGPGLWQLRAALGDRSVDNEPNNSLNDAEFLTFLTMTGGGSINKIITGETLNSSGDLIDYFYFSHKAGLKQVTVTIDLTTVIDLLDQGGVNSELKSVTITPVSGATGQAITIERAVGDYAYTDEWTALYQQLFAAWTAAFTAWQADPQSDTKQADTLYAQHALEVANKIIEADHVNIDPPALGQQIESEFGGSGSGGTQQVRTAMLGFAALYKKWEQPIYRDAVTKAVLNSGSVTVTWNTTGEATAFSVTGLLKTDGIDGEISVPLDVPSITIFVKSEQGAKIPTQNADKFTGTSGPDSWDMLGGNDTVDGGKGNDTLWGNVGNDSILGGDGNDVLDGGPGKDTIDGGAGNDIIRGGSENDKLIGGTGKDNIDAFAGNDTIDAGADKDTVLAGSGNDTVKAGDGNDFVNGETGKDTIDGGAGSDTIVGGAGKDSLTGGGGNDEFRYNAPGDTNGSWAYIITEFDKRGNDRINFADIFAGTLKFRGEKDLTKPGQIHIEDISGPDVLVQVNLDADKTTVELQIRLAGVSASSVTADDFIL